MDLYIYVVIILIAIIAVCVWMIIRSERFSSDDYSTFAAAVIFVCVIGLFILSVDYFMHEADVDRSYVTDNNGQRYEVIEIEGSPYLKGRFGTISPYIQQQKE